MKIKKCVSENLRFFYTQIKEDEVMGGRGASSGSGGVAKELRATKKTISLDEYLARQGLSEGG